MIKKWVIWVIWLMCMVSWNLGFPNAEPTHDIIVAITLSLLSMYFNRHKPRNNRYS